MAEEIDFEFGQFPKFDGPVTLSLTSDDLESYIVGHVLSTTTNTGTTNGFFAFDCGQTDGWTDMFSQMV